MTFEEIKQGEETYIMHTYGRFPIALDHGKGAVSGEIVPGRVTGKMEEERTDDNPDRI